MATRIIMAGAKGRMGEAILRLARNDAAFEIVDEVDTGDLLAAQIRDCDAVIDFTHRSATLEVAQTVAAAGKALVIGTTGHSDLEKHAILNAASSVPVIFSPNYSIGVNTLFYLTEKAAKILNTGFDQEVVEMHHRLKKDAPSGTARRLVEILAGVKKSTYEKLARHGREGEPGARTVEEIGIHALRGGDVVGDHTVIFAALGERVELSHKASSRDTFAQGALRAAAWLKGKPAGVYSMFDVLGLH